MGGQDFDALKKQALTREFKPVPLGLKASIAIKNTLRTIDSQNVVAKLEGSDPRLEGRVRRLLGALGSPRRRRAGQRRQDLQRRARQRVGRRHGARDRARVHAGAAAAEAIDPLPDGHRRGAGAARLAVLRDQSALSAGEDRRQHQHRRRQPVGTDEGHHRRRHGRVGPRRLPAGGRRRSRDARCVPIRNRRRASTTGRTTSTSRSRACRRSTPTRASTSSARMPTTARRSATSTPRTDYHAPSDQMKPDWDLQRRGRRRAAAVRGRLPRRQRRQAAGVEAGQRVQGEARRIAEEVTH